MKVALGSDHAGYAYKKQLIEFLSEKGFDVLDVGAYTTDSCDYPVFGRKVADAILNKEAELGIAICHTGEGIMMSVNKVKGIRCGIGYNEDTAKLLREHNDAQVIAFGACEMDIEDIKKRALIFLNTAFSNDSRHVRRINLIEK